MAPQAAAFPGAEAMDAEARPLQVVRLDMQDNRVSVQEENLRVVCDNLAATGADAVSIVAIMGTYRTGKSFLLDLLMRYLRCWEHSMVVNARHEELEGDAFRQAEWDARMTGKSATEAQEAGHKAATEAVKDVPKESFPSQPRNDQWRCKGRAFPPPAWIAQDREGSQAGFEWRSGMAKCTEGMWFWSRPFVLPNNGRKIAVLLMDTQGAWDGMMTKEQNVSIFGLTALLASKLICNVQNTLTDDKIDCIDYFTTFAQAACSGFSNDEAPFGDIEFLIRDWAWYQAGSSFEDCRATMAQHLQHLLGSGVEGRNETAERLKQTFRSISCFGLPHPGMTVLEPAFTGDFQDISSDFSQLLDEFTRSFFGAGTFPRPSQPFGIEISPSSFENMLRNFIEAFTEDKGSAVHLREAFVKLELFKTRDLLMQKFKYRLDRAAPESRVVDPDAFAKSEAMICSELRKEFVDKITPFKVPDKERQIRDFMETVGQVLDRRRRENLAELEAAQLKLVVSPLVGGCLLFAFGHPVLDSVVLVGVMYLQARKHAAARQTEVLDLDVLRCLGTDIKAFSVQRARDIQAISIAAQRCSPVWAVHQLITNLNSGNSKKAGLQAPAVVLGRA